MTYYDSESRKHWRYKWLRFRTLRWLYCVVTLPLVTLYGFVVGMNEASKMLIEHVQSAK